MAGLQTIVDKASGLVIDRRKVVGVQITRNEIPRTSLTPTKQPWRFKLTVPNGLRYYNNRDLLEELDRLDRYQPQLISFGNNSCINWIFKYQGALSAGQINTLSVIDFVGDQLEIDVSGLSVTGTTVIFKPNDLIQIGAYTFPFTSTTTVVRGYSSSVFVTTNRPNIIESGSVVGAGLTVGSDCDFYMFCPNMPTYKLIPGGYVPGTAGATLNNALIEFSDSFEFYEWVGTA